MAPPRSLHPPSKLRRAGSRCCRRRVGGGGGRRSHRELSSLMGAGGSGGGGSPWEGIAGSRGSVPGVEPAAAAGEWGRSQVRAAVGRPLTCQVPAGRGRASVPHTSLVPTEVPPGAQRVPPRRRARPGPRGSAGQRRRGRLTGGAGGPGLAGRTSRRGWNRCGLRLGDCCPRGCCTTVKGRFVSAAPAFGRRFPGNTAGSGCWWSCSPPALLRTGASRCGRN